MLWILQARLLEWVAFLFSRGSSQPRIEPRSPALWADSLPAEPQGKPNNAVLHTYKFVKRVGLMLRFLITLKKRERDTINTLLIGCLLQPQAFVSTKMPQSVMCWQNEEASNLSEEDICHVLCHALCSVMSDSATPCTVAHRASLSMVFSWLEYWSTLLFPPPGDLPDSGMEPISTTSLALQADSLLLSHSGGS